MKCAFTFNGQHYLAPSKREARHFLAMFGERDIPRRFVTTWRLKTVEKAPSYCQIMLVLEKDKIEFKMR